MSYPALGQVKAIRKSQKFFPFVKVMEKTYSFGLGIDMTEIYVLLKKT